MVCVPSQAPCAAELPGARRDGRGGSTGRVYPAAPPKTPGVTGHVSPPDKHPSARQTYSEIPLGGTEGNPWGSLTKGVGAGGVWAGEGGRCQAPGRGHPPTNPPQPTAHRQRTGLTFNAGQRLDPCITINKQ